MCDKHPRRYPTHKGDKGQTHGGECNRTACKSRRATWWNVGTFGFYCPSCAMSINSAGDRICFPIGRKPTIAEMNAPTHAADIKALSLAMRDERRLEAQARSGA